MSLLHILEVASGFGEVVICQIREWIKKTLAELAKLLCGLVADRFGIPALLYQICLRALASSKIGLANSVV